MFTGDFKQNGVFGIWLVNELLMRLMVAAGRVLCFSITSFSMLVYFLRYCGRSMERLLSSVLRERLQIELFSYYLFEYWLLRLSSSLEDIEFIYIIACGNHQINVNPPHNIHPLFINVKLKHIIAAVSLITFFTITGY
jgi:hypothetical protein